MTLMYHCYGLIADGAKRQPCEEKAVVVYEAVDGWRRGYCMTHRKEGAAEAMLHHWKKIDPLAGTPVSGTDTVVTSLGEDGI